MPRSGSTLIEQILASHPRIHAAGELTNLDRIIRCVCDADGRPVPFPALRFAARRERLCGGSGEAYLASLPTPPSGKTRIIDKAPGNFFQIGLIRLILPHARESSTPSATRSILAFRVSRKSLPQFDVQLRPGRVGPLLPLVHELMTHWRSTLPAGTMLDVCYEDVVDNLEQQARRLIDYCGLPWDDRCLNFHDTSRRIATPSNVQVRRPLYRSSVARWRRYEAFLDPLLAELGLRHQPRAIPSKAA